MLAVQTGKLGLGGETASVLLANLMDLRALEDRSISDMRLASGDNRNRSCLTKVAQPRCGRVQKALDNRTTIALAAIESHIPSIDRYPNYHQWRLSYENDTHR